MPKKEEPETMIIRPIKTWEWDGVAAPQPAIFPPDTILKVDVATGKSLIKKGIAKIERREN